MSIQDSADKSDNVRADNHCLKTWPEYFKPMREGKKLFDVRLDDRGIQVGDRVLFQEYLPVEEAFTGEFFSRTITAKLTDFPGIEEGYCVLGFTHPINESKPYGN